MLPTAARPPDQTIDREELRRKLERGDHFRLVMASSHWAFQAKHIPGSLHFDGLAPLLAALAKDDDIVVYCSNLDCHASIALYQRLVEEGYRHVRHYRGGLLDWEAAGLPLEGDWAATEQGGP